MESSKRQRTDEPGGPTRAAASKSQPTRACAECKKHKIRCDVQPGQAACNKCLRSGIACVPYNLTQKFIDADVVWKSEATSRIDRLEAAVKYLLPQNDLNLSRFDDIQTSPQTTSPLPVSINRRPSPGHIHESPSIANENESDTGFVPAPMSSLYTFTESRKSRPVEPDTSADFIDRGILALEEADYLYQYYLEHINTLLWAGILCPYQDLAQARRSSLILLSAVLTVAAFHAPGRRESLNITYNEFVSLVERASLTQVKSLDDIRGLCIGAFYLTNLSWKLCSQTIRMATEVGLHHVSSSIRRGYTEVRVHEHIRLWYVLYICDHQFATAYGRPTFMHDDGAISNVNKFLQSQYVTPGDVRLAGQLEIQRILNEAVSQLGHDPRSEFNDSDYEQLRAYNLKLDQWRLEWVPRSKDILVYGTYPSKSKILYYHFARFHINALALRGFSTNKSAQVQSLHGDLREAANAAILAATSALRIIIEESDVQRALVGVPIFTHSIIAICASFLIKVAVVFGATNSSHQTVTLNANLSNHGLSFHTSDVLKLVQNLVDVIAVVAEKVSHRHLACDIVVGLRELLRQFRPQDGNTFVYNRATEDLQHNGMPEQSFNDVALQQTYDTVGFGLTENELYAGNFNWSFDDSFLWQHDETMRF